MFKLLMIGVVITGWLLWQNRGYFFVTPSHVIQHQLTQEIHGYAESIQKIWENLKPKTTNQCQNIPKQIKIKSGVALPFNGMRVLGQGCSPLDWKLGCYFTIIGDRGSLFLSYSGQQCLVVNFK